MIKHQPEAAMKSKRNMTLKMEKVDAGNFDEFFSLILKLAEYEHLTPPDGKAKARLRKHALQKRPYYEACIGRIGDKAVGYAIFFMTYSSFLGKPTLYLEDLFVLEEHRGKGTGRWFFDFLFRTAKKRGCGRMEWCALDWNKPAIKFYEKLGAAKLKEWTYFRLTAEKIKSSGK
jgi:GNAT superfamily N-acetyltransferase